MRNQFSVGDEVTAINPKSRTYGYTGTVTESCPWGDVVVHFDHLKAPATFDCDNLLFAGCLSKKWDKLTPAENNEEQKPSLIYVYFHDCEEQPEDIEEARIHGLEEANAVYYDTVANVLDYDDLIEDASDFENLFLIVDGKLVLVETKTTLTPSI